MSPSENNFSQAPEMAGQKVIDQAPKEVIKQNTKKKLSKKAKIVLLIAGWILLLGISTGIAFIVKPAPEVVHMDSITEAYKFSGQDINKVTDVVEDLDYYGYYTTNPLTFSAIEKEKTWGVHTISGLKDKTVENKINNRIMQTASRLNDGVSGQNDIHMEIAANYFNVLSFYLDLSDNNGDRHYEYFTFDLNTGDELHFDDLFSANINLTSLLFKDFYDSLATKIQFAKLYANQRLAAEPYFPDPSQCAMQYCPLPGETYDDLRRLITEYDDQIANIEQVATKAIQDYLAGEKQFYLNASGPVFILSDGTAVTMELKDNIRYAVYLKNYRSMDSIYEDESIAMTNQFFTQNPSAYARYVNEETDTYLFTYVTDSDGDSISQQALQNYVKDKGLSAPSDAEKFRHISASGHVFQDDKVRSGYLTICVNETDKSYYDSTYRKSIIDNGFQQDWSRPIKTGHYDVDRVVEVSIQNSDGDDYCSQQTRVAITNAGTILEKVDDILVDPPNREGWKDYLKRMAYNYVCHRSWDPVCYTEEEKQAHELTYVFKGNGIGIRLKKDSESNPSYFYDAVFKDIPIDYINPEVLVE